MKKLFTLIAASMAVTGAFAQAAVKDLECSHLNIYMTTDTVKYYKDAETGEVTVYPWSGNEVAEALITAGLPISGFSSTDLNYVYAFRNDYKDEETGFEVKKGYYRAMFVDGNLNMYGTAGENDHKHGYTNLKKVILYFVGLPQTWFTETNEKGYTPQWGNTPFAISHQDYPTGRVYAQYNDPETGAKISNNAYREVHITQSKTDPSAETPGTGYLCMGDSNIVYGLKDFLGYTPHASADHTSIDPRLVTYDRPFKLTVTLDNSCDEKNDPKMTDFQTRSVDGVSGEKGEWNDVMIDGLTETQIDYYFGDINEQNPYWNQPDNIGSDCTTGRNTVTGSWSKKFTWASDQPISWGVKRRMVLVGVSMVSGSPNMPPQFVNAGDGQAAEIAMGEGSAYGSNPANEFFPATTEKIDAGNAFSDRPYLRTDMRAADPSGVAAVKTNKKASAKYYNLNGQEVTKAYKGMIISNGIKFMNK